MGFVVVSLTMGNLVFPPADRLVRNTEFICQLLLRNMMFSAKCADVCANRQFHCGTSSVLQVAHMHAIIVYWKFRKKAITNFVNPFHGKRE